MKQLTTLTLIGAVSALALGATAASAQPYGDRYDGYRQDSYRSDSYRGDGYRGGWVSIDQRLAQLDRRIDQGVRDGSLNRREAWRLRGEFNDLARLQARYRTNGLTGWERADLDRRFDILSNQIRAERHDQYGYGYGYDRR
jgi:hypothetical protein